MDKIVGISLHSRHLERQSELILDNFNCLTPITEGSFSHVRKDNWDWQGCDKVYEFCQDNGLFFRMTPLFCLLPRHLPQWVVKCDNPFAVLKEFLKEALTRYPNCIGFPVINEFVSDNGLIMEQSFWYQLLGPEYYKAILGYCRSLESGAKLFIEDHRVQYPKRWDKVVELTEELKGLHLIDGVGIHGHHDWPPSPLQLPNFKSVVDRLESLDVEVHISEISLGLVKGAKPLGQGAAYKEFIKKLPQKNPVVFWGFKDNVKSRNSCLFTEEGPKQFTEGLIRAAKS